jgi:hypothetical protein
MDRSDELNFLCSAQARRMCLTSDRRQTLNSVLGERNESFGFGKENLPQLQDHSP